MYDMIIVGGGPAGLTAAVYGRRAGKSVLVIEKDTFGGQITFSPCVENIPGFVSLSGSEFAEKLVDQAIYQGAEFESARVLSVSRVITDPDAEKPVMQAHFRVRTDDERVFEGKTVIAACGARHRLLGLPGEEDLIGNGISFCAVCDGAFYQDQVVGVVGGGNSALQEAVLLSDLVKKLYIFQDLPELTGEKKLQETLYGKKNVEILTGVRVEALLGEEALEGVRILEKENGAAREILLSGLFIAIGLIPQNEPFRELITTDPRGYIRAGEDCATGVPGLYAAGDGRTKRVRQVATAAADGAEASLAAQDYLEGRA